jgi:multidrug efflux pump subunit AcrB
MKRFVAAFARNTVFANILLVGFILAGVLASMMMVREMFPEFSVEVVTVSVPYPGADPAEVEEGIARKIEEAVEGIEGVKTVVTRSNENSGQAVIEIIEGYDVAKAKDEIKNRVDAITTFPVEAERPIVSEVTLTREVLIVALSGPVDERTLKEWAERVKDEIRNLPGVSQVAVAGTREYEIAVEVSEERLREYGLSFEQVAGAIRQSNLNQPGGTLRTEGEEVRLRTIGRKYWGDEFEDIVVVARPGGDIVTIGDIATVKDSFVEDDIQPRLNGEPALALMVSKTSEEDAIQISDVVHDYVAEAEATLPEGMRMVIWSDMSELIEDRIDLLVRNGAVGLLLVFVLLWLFLDLRLSFWSAMGIPISLAGGLAVMMFVGATINMISLFGLIMVLGIVVDDAIVVGEAIYVHRKRGDGPLAAAVNGTMEVGMPVIAAVVTTCIAFLPLMFVGGVMGKFIRIMPVAVISALVISLVECLVMLPAHLSHLPDPDDPKRLERMKRNPFRRIRRAVSEGLEWFIERVYMPFLERALAWRYFVFATAVAILLFTVGLIRAGTIKYVMFPTVDGNDLTATVEFPAGTPIEVTKKAVDRMEAGIRTLERDLDTESGEPLVKNLFSVVGGTLSDDPGSTTMAGGTHVGAVRVEMLESQYRGVHSRRIKTMWEEAIGPIPGAIALTIEGMEAGPPGKPIEVWVKGHDLDRILVASNALVERLETFEGTSQVQHDFRPGKNEIRFELKPEARAMGLTVQDLARQVYAGFYGEEALRLQRGRDDIRVRVRYPRDERSQLAELESVRIRTPQGHEVPLKSVASLSYGPGYSGISRSDGLRRVVVTSDLDTNVANAQEILAKLEQDFFPQLQQEYHGLQISVEGEKKDSGESMKSLAVGFPLALVGIFIIIATMFRSYVQPLVIMVTVPFGVIGAAYGHLFYHYGEKLIAAIPFVNHVPQGMPLTMISLFGIVALSGVVVNDAIVLIECVNGMVARGVPFFEALKRGGARRFRAVFLTTLTTVGGLAPLIAEQDLQAQFLKPMALSIAAGVAFATALTLLLVPCLLGILNDARRVTRRALTGTWADPNEVEPARHRNADLSELDETPDMPVASPGPDRRQSPGAAGDPQPALD